MPMIKGVSQIARRGTDVHVRCADVVAAINFAKLAYRHGAIEVSKRDSYGVKIAQFPTFIPAKAAEAELLEEWVQDQRREEKQKSTEGRVTLSRINAWLDVHGYGDVRIHRGNGYFYLRGGAADRSAGSSIYVNALNHLSFTRWTEEVMYIIKGGEAWIAVDEGKY